MSTTTIHLRMTRESWAVALQLDDPPYACPKYLCHTSGLHHDGSYWPEHVTCVSCLSHLKDYPVLEVWYAMNKPDKTTLHWAKHTPAGVLRRKP